VIYGRLAISPDLPSSSSANIPLLSFQADFEWIGFNFSHSPPHLSGIFLLRCVPQSEAFSPPPSLLQFRLGAIQYLWNPVAFFSGSPVLCAVIPPPLLVCGDMCLFAVVFSPPSVNRFFTVWFALVLPLTLWRTDLLLCFHSGGQIFIPPPTQKPLGNTSVLLVKWYIRQAPFLFFFFKFFFPPRKVHSLLFFWMRNYQYFFFKNTAHYPLHQTTFLASIFFRTFFDVTTSVAETCTTYQSLLSWNGLPLQISLLYLLYNKTSLLALGFFFLPSSPLPDGFHSCDSFCSFDLWCIPCPFGTPPRDFPVICPKSSWCLPISQSGRTEFLSGLSPLFRVVPLCPIHLRCDDAVFSIFRLLPCCVSVWSTKWHLGIWLPFVS